MSGRQTGTHRGDGVVVGEGECGIDRQQARGVDALPDELLDVGGDVVAEVTGSEPVQRHQYYRLVPATWRPKVSGAGRRHCHLGKSLFI